MKKIICILLIFIVFAGIGKNVYSLNETEYTPSAQSVDFTVSAKSAILIEADTGKVLFNQNEKEQASPASVTKIMTLLLVVEAVDEGKISLNDRITVSNYAASMGGSQVFLEEGEQFTVEELLKCTVISSANDAAVALAEHVYGSETIFVNMMNTRAKELNMLNTNFENVTGLDDTTENHVTSAEDIAIMSRELIQHDVILKYSSLWQDSIRGGEFTLTNTNRLVRYYDGCNGLKTGSTDKAGYCISATAKRNGMQLIAVVMGCETRDIRNATVRALLDYGFSNYELYSCEEKELENIPIYNGAKDSVAIYSTAFSTVIPKEKLKNIEMKFEIPKNLTAPIRSGDKIGSVTYKIDNEIIGYSDIYVKENINKLTLLEIFIKMVKNLFTGV